MKENNNDELQFIVNKYKEGHMDSDTAWNEFLDLSGLSTRISYRRWLAVACIALAAIIAVAATIFIANRNKITPKTPSVNKEKMVTDTLTKDTLQVKDSVRVFRFDNTPVNSALKDISNFYGVQLEASDTTKDISGEFEAHNVDEAIDLLQATLNIKIEKVK